MNYSSMEKTMCIAEITTSDQEDDYMDVDLTIKFKNGPLEGKKYFLCIDIENGEVV